MIKLTLDHLCPLVVAGLLLSGCAGLFSYQPQQKLQDELSKETTANRALEEQLAGLQLQLLEQDAQVKEVNKKLDDATLEVVRAKAKLQSLESKAEAASTLAEGEIAMKALKSKVAGVKDPVLNQAESLLNSSNQELKKENYGGALYLAAQAKTLIKEEQERLKGQEENSKLEGEVPFAIPLQLRVVSSANLRKGPGLDTPIVFTMKEGQAVVGYSYRGLWVRVKTEDGQGGWIHYSLVDGRSK
jgi:Bacterial SH3 domain